MYDSYHNNCPEELHHTTVWKFTLYNCMIYIVQLSVRLHRTNIDRFTSNIYREDLHHATVHTINIVWKIYIIHVCFTSYSCMTIRKYYITSYTCPDNYMYIVQMYGFHCRTVRKIYIVQLSRRLRCTCINV